MRIPKAILKLIDSFERLPGIGPKTAQRLTFHLLHFPESDLQQFANSLVGLKTGTKLCTVCKNVSEDEKCSVCLDPNRNKALIAVVSNPLDSFALEKTGFKGTYHVLHGIIDPLNNMGPEELFVKELVSRVGDLLAENSLVEVILATNTSLEGEATAIYLAKVLVDTYPAPAGLKLTRIARGLPVGGDIEFADDITLSRALDGRSAV